MHNRESVLKHLSEPYRKPPGRQKRQLNIRMSDKTFQQLSELKALYEDERTLGAFVGELFADLLNAQHRSTFPVQSRHDAASCTQFRDVAGSR